MQSSASAQSKEKEMCMDDCFHLAVVVHLPPATGKGGFLDPNRFMASSPAFQLACPPNGMTRQVLGHCGRMNTLLRATEHLPSH
jgi:hypothetical protein